MTHDAKSKPDGSRSLSTVCVAGGIGAIISSAVMALMSLTSKDLSGAAFEAVRAPIDVAIVAGALAGLIVIAAGGWRASEVRRAVVALLLFSIGLTVAGVVAYYGLLSNGYVGQSNHRAAVGFGLLVGGFMWTAVWLLELWAPSTDIGSQPTPVKWLAGTAVLVPIVATVIATVPWTASMPEDESHELAIKIGDIHPVTGAEPDRISLTPKRIPLGPEVLGDDSDRPTEAEALSVGPGLFTSNMTMINGDTGTVRWSVPEATASYFNVVVVPESSLVVIATPGWREDAYSIAIDAESGRVRWTVPFALTVGRFDGISDTEFRSERALMVVSGDARTIRMISPTTGETVWQHEVDRDCAVIEAHTDPSIAVSVSCVGAPAAIVRLDHDTGREIDRREELGVSDMRYSSGLKQLDDAFLAVAVPGDPFPSIVGLTERGSGRKVTGLSDAQSSVDGVLSSAVCTESGECLLGSGGQRQESRSRIVSLNGRHPDVVVDAAVTRGSMDVIWLRDQLIWIEENAESEGDSSLVVVDRRSGAVKRVPTPDGILRTVPGAVVVLTSDDMIRFGGSS